MRCTFFFVALALVICPPRSANGAHLWDTFSKGVKLFSQFININPDSPISPFVRFVSERLMLRPSSKKINNAFSDGRASARRGKSMDKPLIETIIEQPRISRMLSTMQDPRLMDHVLLEVDGRLAETDNDCPQQLLCRLSPIVKGMQTSLAFFLKEKVFHREDIRRGDTAENGGGGEARNKNQDDDLSATWQKLTPMERLLFFMPTFQDFMKEGEPCRRKFAKCGSQ